jgi:uncharacterized protein (TIRG00374 family)
MLAKLALAAGILGWLVYQLRGEDLFTRLVQEPKVWSRLAIAQVTVLAAFSINIVRWYLLVRALDLQFHLGDAFRLGSLGFMLNQVAPGSVGGDLFKAAFIAKEQPGRKTEAVATVVIDRVVGLYAMLLVATCGRGLSRSASESHVGLQTLSTIVAVLAVAATVGLAVILSWDLAAPRLLAAVQRVPLVGHTATRLLTAVAAYRHRRRYLLWAIGLSGVAHVLLVLAFWQLSQGLPVYAPSLSQMMLVGPMSLVAGAIPVTPAGLGTLEAAMDSLFTTVGAAPGDGFLVALAYRVGTYVVASLGGIYYFTARGKVDRLLHDAEELADQIE